MNTDAKQKYEELFSSDEEKARAFDRIAERYYFMNFGSMSKTDLDVLMFSLYIERILDKDNLDFRAYSDYTLSKDLGITQSRISSLKVKKQLQYPYARFDWKESLGKIADRAIYEDGRIKLQIPDRNLFLEIKNAVEESGGHVEVQLTSNLLQIRPSYFLDLLVAIDGGDRQELMNHLRDIVQKNNPSIDLTGKASIGQALVGELPGTIIDLIGECIPVFGGPIKIIAEHVFHAIQSSKK